MTDIAVAKILLYVNSEIPADVAKLEEVFPRSVELAWRRLPFEDATLGASIDELMTDDVGGAVANLDEFVTFGTMISSEWQVGASGQHEISKVVRARLNDGSTVPWKVDPGTGPIDVYARVEWTIVTEP